MGDRGQIKIIQEEDQPSIYLYAHWSGSSLKEDLRVALGKKERWDDPEYLTRIIFSVMIRKEIDGTTGFGIGLAEQGDLNNPLIIVSCPEREVIIEGKKWPFSEFIKEIFK